MFKTWNDVFVPEVLVQKIHSLGPGRIMDSLVHQIVFKKKRRPVKIYSCNKCGEIYIPNKSTEEISFCEQCSSWDMCCRVDFKFSLPVPFYSNQSKQFDLEKIYIELQNAFIYYYKEKPTDQKFINCGWKEGIVYCKFLGGEECTGFDPRSCMIKSAILCPYLWDFSFNWSEKKDEDIENTDHLTPILRKIYEPSI